MSSSSSAQTSSQNSLIPAGINVPFLRQFRSTRSLSAAWSPHNVLASIAAESVFLAFSFDTHCSSNHTNSNNNSSGTSSSIDHQPQLSFLHEIKHPSNANTSLFSRKQVAIPIDAKWHPRLTPECFPAQTALAILYSDGSVSIEYVSLESTSKISVERVCVLTPDEVFAADDERSSSTNNNNNQPRQEQEQKKVPITFSLEWIAGDGQNPRTWSRLMLFAKERSLLVRFNPPSSGVGRHTCELIREFDEGSHFRPVHSSTVMLPRRSDTHVVAETVVAVLCGATRSVRFYADSTVLTNSMMMTMNNSTGSSDKNNQEGSISRLTTSLTAYGAPAFLDLGEHLPSVYAISLAPAFTSDDPQYCPENTSNKNIVNTMKAVNDHGNYFTLCAIGPGAVFAITYFVSFVSMSTTNKSDSHNLAQQRLKEFGVSLKKIAVHRQSTRPYVAAPCSSSKSTSIPLELTSVIPVGPVDYLHPRADDNNNSLVNYRSSSTMLTSSSSSSYLRFLAFSPHEIIEINVPSLSAEEMLNRMRGIQKDIYSTSTTTDACHVKVIASSESDAQIEKDGLKFFRMILGLAIHPSKEFCSMLIRGVWSRINTRCQTWLFVASMDNYQLKAAAATANNTLNNTFDDNNRTTMTADSDNNKTDDTNNTKKQGMASTRQHELKKFFDVIQESVFASRKRRIVKTALSKNVAQLVPIVELKDAFSSHGGSQNYTWPLPFMLDHTGLAATVERPKREIQNSMLDNVLKIVEDSIQREHYHQNDVNKMEVSSNNNNGESRIRGRDNNNDNDNDHNEGDAERLLLSSSLKLNEVMSEKFLEGLKQIGDVFTNVGVDNNNNKKSAEIFKEDISNKVSHFFKGSSIGRPLLTSALYFFVQHHQHRATSSNHNRLTERTNEAIKSILHLLILPHCCDAIQKNVNAPNGDEESLKTAARAFAWLKLFCNKYTSERQEFCAALLERAEMTISRSKNAKKLLALTSDDSKTNSNSNDTCPICKKQNAIGVNLDLCEGTECVFSSSASATTTASQQQQDDTAAAQEERATSHIALVSPTSFRSIMLYDEEGELNLVATRCTVCGCGEQLNEHKQRGLCAVCGGFLSS